MYRCATEVLFLYHDNNVFHDKTLFWNKWSACVVFSLVTYNI